MNALEFFALAVLEESRESLSDLDGGWIQDKAEELGLLFRIDVAKACGEACVCAEYGDFPQKCLRYTKATKAKFVKYHDELEKCDTGSVSKAE